MINNEVFDQDATQKLLEKKTNEIYGSLEARNQFEIVKKLFKNAKKISEELSDNPKLIGYLTNYDSLVNKLFVTLFDPILQTLINEKANILNERNNLNKIRKKYQFSSDNKLFDIWEKFAARFKFKKFDLGIENAFTAYTGISMPRFVKYIPETKTIIDDPQELRFSTGEVKIFNMINVILEIERNILLGENFTVILDDAVDSFDYKNKYGIIDYLIDIKDNPNIQLIIFTHNFDFYRSSILALGKSSVSQYFVYRDIATEEITFFNSKNKGYYLEISNFNNWKNTPSLSQYFAMLPFARNILQLESNSHAPNVVKIDSYLHFDSNDENKNFALVDSILQTQMKINFPRGVSTTDIFLKVLSDEAMRILNNGVNETDLDVKITLGLYIRIFLERYLCKVIFDKTNSFPLSTNIYSKTRDYISQASQYLRPDDINKAIEANVIVPSYVHANSFMYEPLIDVGISELKEITHWLIMQNNKWPL